MCAWLISFKGDSTRSTCLARDLIECGGKNLAGYTINNDLDVSSGVTLQAPTLDFKCLTTSREASFCAYRLDLRVSLDIPAVVLVSKLAVLSRIADVCVANAEAHFRYAFTGELVTSARHQSIGSVVREAGFIVNEALRIAAGARNLNEDYWVHVCRDCVFVIGGHSIEYEVNILVPEDLIWRRVIKQWCVAQVIVNLALVFYIIRTRRIGRFRRVGYFKFKLKILVLVCNVMRRDHLHAIVAQKVSDRRHCVGKSPQVYVRLDLVIYVQRLSDQSHGISLQGNHLDLIDKRHVVKALSINEKL